MWVFNSQKFDSFLEEKNKGTIFLLRLELNKCEDVWLNLKLYSLCFGEGFKSTKRIIKTCRGNKELID
jgi:hypothetical protein